ncbi:MAG: TIGR03936 family radical SAM-associated protein [Clostridia bacterium]|nr:TIGR03936 family radical SAM-associated protein [Clostridia bacterium]
MRSVRLWYKKSGLAIYTSHLDMNRCFTRAVRRARIPLWYTEGFNPHPYRTFLLPLPLGQTGLREPIDLRIEGEITDEEIQARMNAALPDGLEIVAVTAPAQKANEIAAAEYTITLTFVSEGEAAGFAAGAQAVMDSGELNAEKRSKRGIKTVNLCTLVRRFACEAAGETVRIAATLAAGSTVNLNADLLASALLAEFAAAAQVSITRTALLREDLTDFE